MYLFKQIGVNIGPGSKITFTCSGVVNIESPSGESTSIAGAAYYRNEYPEKREEKKDCPIKISFGNTNIYICKS